jgi:co-chaperonin GroES (HSP10)
MEYDYNKPLGDRIVIKIIKNKEEKTSGGLLKPVGSDDTMLGKVIETGAGLFTHSGVRIPITVRPNDLVLLQGTGVKHKNGPETYQIYRESDILSIMTEKK